MGLLRVAGQHPTIRALWNAYAISVLGDFIGAGALLVLAYNRTGGQALASGAILMTMALAAWVTGFLGGGLLDGLPRRRALVASHLVGGAAIGLVLVLESLLAMYVAAAVLGGARAVSAAVRAGAIAESVPRELHGVTFAGQTTIAQVGQIVGYLAGGALVTVLGAATALGIDAATFVIAAILLARAPLTNQRHHRRATSPREGLRTIFDLPSVRITFLLIVASMPVSAVPEALAPKVAAGNDWLLPVVMASNGVGHVLGAVLVGHRPWLARPVTMAWLATAGAVPLLLGGFGWPAAVILANIALGVALAWTIAGRVVVADATPPERMAHVTAIFSSTLMVIEGVGASVFGRLADVTSVGFAYAMAGALLGAAAAWVWVLARREVRNGRISHQLPRVRLPERQSGVA